MWYLSALAIFFGAGLGALLRWLLALALNPLLPMLPLGTLASNAIGGMLMGVAMAIFVQYQDVSPLWRLAITTGFLGGLTTFSTYSAEAVSLLQRGDYRWAGLHIGAHVLVSLAATWVGLVATQAAMRGLAR